MKAFDEWFAEYLAKISNKWSRLMAARMKPLYAIAWRAALKTALKNANCIGPINCNGIPMGCEIKKWIKEELKK